MTTSTKSHSKLLATIVSDASFCPRTQAGAWAVWVVSKGIRLKKTGVFKNLCHSSAQAEVQSIMNGLHFAKHVFKPRHYHVVTDCVQVIQKLDPRKPSFNTMWAAQMREIIGECATISFAHVKAHNGPAADARSAAHNWCDAEARMSMRKQRREMEIANGQTNEI